MSAENYVAVCDREELEAEGRTVVQHDGRAIALFFHEEEVYAVVLDDRPALGLELLAVADGHVVLCGHTRYDGRGRVNRYLKRFFVRDATRLRATAPLKCLNRLRLCN